MATVSIEKVKREIVTTKECTEYVLRLSPTEAYALKAVLGQVYSGGVLTNDLYFKLDVNIPTINHTKLFKKIDIEFHPTALKDIQDKLKEKGIE